MVYKLRVMIPPFLSLLQSFFYGPLIFQRSGWDLIYGGGGETRPAQAFCLALTLPLAIERESWK